ncbi:penicillin-binding protein activator [Marinomonas sp.]|uniref:penicillin-binding protein activator n=1 Tax=Marinomonas sp. TaxID=1904862 RepID=UPI003BA86601
MEQPQNRAQAINNGSQERTLPPSIYHPKKTTDVSKALADSYISAKNLYQQGEYQQTIDILEDKLLTTPSSIQFEAYLLAALSASYLDNSIDSMHYLEQADQLIAARHPDNQNKLKETKASILEYFGNWLEVVDLRMDLTYNLPLNQGEENQAKLWMAIQNLTQNEVDELFQQQKPLLNGWLTISSILRNQTLSIEQQLKMFKNWQAENPNHPAALSPPQDFEIMASVEQMAPKKIVLMLPMSGKLARASQAIVDGFFASFYKQKEARPEINVVNIDDYATINEAIAAANEKQPDVIIGPLQKNNVAQVSRLDLPYPVIALNQLDINQHPKNLYHFSLSAEDEIHELIAFAKQEGATKAAILSTQDTWALKQSDEFRAEAVKENVTIISNQSYANTPKGRQDAIQKLLLINESYARKRSIEKWIGTSVDSIARSREDLDYVYYIGKLNDAKQIRPLLDFYFADKTPMLASSTLNDSAPERSTKPEDIERILFTEVPALTPNNNSLDVLPKNQNSNILRRLQALGADSYLLANKYQLFTLLPSTKISANTGIITMDENGIFHKRPEIMTYRKGNLVYATNHQFFEQKENAEK